MNKVEFYIKCGEIFKSQQNDGNPFMLRCLQCQEVYLLLESFILHFDDECLQDTIKKENNGVNKIDDSMIEDQNLFGTHTNYRESDEMAYEIQKVKKSLVTLEFNKDVHNVDKSSKKIKTKKEPRMPKLIPHEIENVIEIYKGFPHLWNTSLVEFFCTNKKNESMQEMLQTLATQMSIQISSELLTEYLQRLHNSFSRAKRKKLNLRFPKTSNDFAVKGNLEDFYENMTFLSDHVAPFRCSECDKEINGVTSYKIHKSQHSGSAPFTCSVCNREFTSPTTYISHAKRHMGDVKYECKECNKKFYIERDIKLHMLEHTGAKPFCCEICGTSFRHVQSFTIHRRKHEKNYLHTCHICSRGFYTMELYKDHMNSHTNTRPHICQVCGKAFINKKGLRVHELIHDDIRKHACKVCGKTFKHKSGLHQHMRTHAIAKYEQNSINNYLDVYVN